MVKSHLADITAHKFHQLNAPYLPSMFYFAWRMKNAKKPEAWTEASLGFKETSTAKHFWEIFNPVLPKDVMETISLEVLDVIDEQKREAKQKEEENRLKQEKENLERQIQMANAAKLAKNLNSEHEGGSLSAGKSPIDGQPKTPKTPKTPNTPHTPTSYHSYNSQNSHSQSRTFGSQPDSQESNFSHSISNISRIPTIGSGNDITTTATMTTTTTTTSQEKANNMKRALDEASSLDEFPPLPKRNNHNGIETKKLFITSSSTSNKKQKPDAGTLLDVLNSVQRPGRGGSEGGPPLKPAGKPLPPPVGIRK